MPPYSSGNGSPNRPISAIPDTTSYGKLCSASCLAATGATTRLREVADRLGQLRVIVGEIPGRQIVSHRTFLSCGCGDPGQRLAHLDLIAHGDKNFHDAVDGCGQRVLHLHRLDGDDDGAGGHLRAGLDVDRDDRTRHRADEFGVAAVLVVGPHRSLAHFLEHSHDRRPTASQI